MVPNIFHLSIRFDIFIYMRKDMILSSIDIAIQSEIIKFYCAGMMIKEIAVKLQLPYHWIRKVLISNKISLRRFADYKWQPTKNEEMEILDLYQHKRGIQYIADKFSTNWDRIEEILDKHKINRWSRIELTKANVEFYGNSSGFTGHTHTNLTKQKMSKSQLNNKNRMSTTGPKSRYVETTIGKVQGSYEVAYLQQYFEVSGSLPIIGRAVHTPYGSYIPDFDSGEVFIEIKSKFTWEICQGMRENQKGIKTDIQHKKIKWVDKNVKPVIVYVLEDKMAKDLFKRAIVNKQIVTENIIYKNGKYYKEYPLLCDGL
jgi:hypothetical protein